MIPLPRSLAYDYGRDGPYLLLQASLCEQALALRAQSEQHEAATGGPLRAAMRHPTHLLFTWVNQLVRQSTTFGAPDQAVRFGDACSRCWPVWAHRFDAAIGQ